MLCKLPERERERVRLAYWRALDEATGPDDAFLIPYVARQAEDAGRPQREERPSTFVFQSFNRYLGVAVGEYLGYTLTGASGGLKRRSFRCGTIERWGRVECKRRTPPQRTKRQQVALTLARG